MMKYRVATVALAVLALGAVSACDKTTGTGGPVTCVATDPICPSGSLTLGLTQPTGAPTIVPGTSGTSFNVSGSSYVITGTTSATTLGYWLLVSNDVLSSWGVLAVSGGVYGGEIPLFCGSQRVYLTFTNAAGRSYYVVDINRTGCTGPSAFRVQLTWVSDPTSDLDLHLLRPGGSMNSTNDCYYLNCQGSGLTWGASNPVLDVDDQTGYGPENIYLNAGAEAGEYRIVINDWDNTAGEIATVKIYFNDVEAARYTSLAMDGATRKYWEVAKVNIVSHTITPVGNYSSSAPVTLGAPPAWEPITK